MLSEAFLQFHFLRPEWLVGLILLPVLWLVFSRRQAANNDWNKAIDPNLLIHLTPGQNAAKKPVKRISLLIALLFCVIAMAGPTWQEKPQPVVEVKDDMVVILDLSLSMLATDTSPTRLTRTKHKLQDLLDLRKEGNTALIAFSGDSHVVTPLTDDTRTILANLPALDPFLMPVIGSRPDLAIEQAVQLLEQGLAKRGRIVLLTDGVEAHQVERINESLSGKPISLNVLAAGTKNGAPINLPDGRGYLKDGDQVVIPKTNFKRLRDLAFENQGRFSAIALDDSDLKHLDISGERLIQEKQETAKEGLDKRFDAWEDMGYIFLICALPLLLLAHRQGAMLLLLILVYPHEPTHAFEWEALWKNPDQRAQALLQEGNAEQAAETFESPSHKAFAQYQAGQYEQAEKNFSALDNTTAQYNLGNALAKQQKFEEAISAYESVLSQNPDHDDAAYNKQLVEQILEQMQQSNSEQSDSENSDEQQNNDNQQSQNSQEQQNDQQSSENQPSQEQQSNQDQADRKQNQSSQEQSEQEQAAQQDHKQEDQTEQGQQAQEEKNESESDEQLQEERSANQQAIAEAMAEELSDEEKQSFEQWMRRVPDDPGGLLRRKFEQQARERNRTAREKGEPLW